MMVGRFGVRTRLGFTLVELLVVIAIIGILVALLLPAIQAAREAGRRASCQNKIKQLTTGLHNFHDTLGTFPAGAEGNVLPYPNPPGNTTTIVGTSWIVHVLPFIEQKALYDQYRFDLSYNNTANSQVVGRTVLETLKCPSGFDPKRYRDPNTPSMQDNVSTQYFGVMGPSGPTDNFTIVTGTTTYTYRVGSAAGNGAWSGHGILSHYTDDPASTSISKFRKVRIADVLDGTTNTLMLGEISLNLPSTVGNQYRSWVRGNNGGSGTTKNVRYPINSTYYNGSNNFNEISFGSHHPTGCQFGMADASVKFINQSIDLQVYIMSASINTNEPIILP